MNETLKISWLTTWWCERSRNRRERQHVAGTCRLEAGAPTTEILLWPVP